MTISTLPNSAGWNEIGPIATHRRAPLIVRPSPGTIGNRSRINPARPIVYVYASSIRSSRIEHERQHERDQPDAEPRHLLDGQVGLQPPDHREPERGQERRGRQQHGIRAACDLAHDEPRPMKPAAMSEPYSSMLGGTRPRLPSPTNAYAPMPAASASSSSHRPLETRGERSVVAVRLMCRRSRR